MGEVAGQFVFDPQLFFLEAVEKVFVGVGPMLFLVDQRVERGVLDSRASAVALSIGGCPFPKANVTVKPINHKSWILS